MGISNGYVAGTVGCSYPRPVEPSNVEDVINFHDQCHDLYRVSVVVANCYDSDSNYIPASINGINDFRSNFELDSVVKRGFYHFNAFKIYSTFEIINVQENNFYDFINKIMNKCKGTLHVSFYELNYWRGRKNVTEFSLLSI